MGRNYKQITLAERCQIIQLLAAGSKIREIAAALDRAPSTIARELKRNGSRTKGYEPSYAQQQARARRWNGCRLERDQGLREVVLTHLAYTVAAFNIMPQWNSSESDAQRRTHPFIAQCTL